MKLHLERPLAFFDLETTGINVASDRIVEIAVVKVMPDGQIHSKPEKSGAENRIIINPEMPIPLEVSMIHGIYDKDVLGKPTFKQIAKGLYKFLHGCDLAGFNSNKFDIPLIAEEFLRVDIDFNVSDRNLIDVQTIFHIMEQRTLSAAFKFYCDKSLAGAHEALPDTAATHEIFEAQIERYLGVETKDARGNVMPKFENNMDVLHKFCQRNRNADLLGRLVYGDDDKAQFNFGKYKGKTVESVLANDPGYYSWMMKGDFPRYTKKVLTEIKNAL